MNVHMLLHNILPFINTQLKSINSGGCGILALELCKALHANDIPAEVVLVYHGDVDASDVADLIARMHAETITGAWDALLNTTERIDPCNDHLCVRVANKLYDSDGTYNRSCISDGIALETLSKFNTRPNTWNSHFLACNGSDMEAITNTLQEFFNKSLKGATL